MNLRRSGSWLKTRVTRPLCVCTKGAFSNLGSQNHTCYHVIVLCTGGKSLKMLPTYEKESEASTTGHFTWCLRSHCRCQRAQRYNRNSPLHQKNSAQLWAATCPVLSCCGCPCSSGPPHCDTSLGDTQTYTKMVSLMCEPHIRFGFDNSSYGIVLGHFPIH